MDKSPSEDMKKVSQKGVFKKYYADPKFREKHLAYMKTKIPCECEKMVTRVNLNRHKKSHIHKDRMKKLNQLEQDKMKIYSSNIKELTEKILKLLKEKENELK